VSTDEPIRVALGCDYFLRYTAMLAGGMEAVGARVALVTRDHDGEFGDRPGAAAEFVERATGPETATHRLRGRVRSPGGISETVRLRREVRRFAPDVVHVQESIGNDVRLLLALGARPRRFALTVHDPVRHPGDHKTISNTYGNRALVRTAGLIFVHGDALREELVETESPRAPIVVVPHGIDPGTPQPPPERPSILFFGRISHYKGVDTLLDAMGEVWRRLPEAALTIAGAGELEDHPALADARVTLRHEHVPDDEVPGLLAAASCVALPYRQASQSGVGSLAKRHARPLVVTAVGGLPELVADGSGVAVPSEDPDRLAEALVTVLRDRAAAARMGEAGVAAAEREGGWGSVAERTLAAYREHLLSV
jgi:glycosyltransferase involved in cell wall biosynthesis